MLKKVKTDKTHQSACFILINSNKFGEDPCFKRVVETIIEGLESYAQIKEADPGSKLLRTNKNYVFELGKTHRYHCHIKVDWLISGSKGFVMIDLPKIRADLLSLLGYMPRVDVKKMRADLSLRYMWKQ